MKTIKLILKILAAAALIAGVVFAVIHYWDPICDFVSKLRSKLKDCRLCRCSDECDYGDFEDVDF